MADLGYVQSSLSGVRDVDGLRQAVDRVFRYVLRSIRFGRAEASEPSENLAGGFFTATTDAVANTEFTVTHSLGRTPYLLIPVLPLDQVNARIVRLKVTRAADANRIYLSSPDTSAVFFYYLEG